MPIQPTSIWLWECLQLSAWMPWLLWRQAPKPGGDVSSSGWRLPFQGIPKRKYKWGPPQLWEPWSSVLSQQLQRGSVFKPPTTARCCSIGGGFISCLVYSLQHPPNQCNWQWRGRSKVVARIVIFKPNYNPEKYYKWGINVFLHTVFSVSVFNGNPCSLSELYRSFWRVWSSVCILRDHTQIWGGQKPLEFHLLHQGIVWALAQGSTHTGIQL